MNVGNVVNECEECENEAPTWFPKILTRKRNNRTTLGFKNIQGINGSDLSDLFFLQSRYICDGLGYIF